jgi:hypothetical protein
MNKLLTIIYLILISACNPKPPIVPGMLDKVSDAVMVKCHPYEYSAIDDIHTCVVFASPRLEQLKVFDATAKQFVLGKTYFPLPIKVGVATNKLASSNLLPLVFALDQVENKIFVTYTQNINGNIAFSDPKFFDTNPQPFTFVIDYVPNKRLRAIITSPNKGEIQVINLDEKTGLKISLAPNLLTDITKQPYEIKIDQENNLAVISDFAAKNIYIYDLETNKEATPQLDVAGPIRSLAIGRLKLGSNIIPVALLIRADEPKVKFISLKSPFDQSKEIEIPAGPWIAYMPEGNDKNWGLVSNKNATLQYIEMVGLDIKTAVIKANSNETIDLTNLSGANSLATFPTAIAGGKIINKEGEEDACSEKAFITFQSPFAASICDKANNAEKLGL